MPGAPSRRPKCAPVSCRKDEAGLCAIAFTSLEGTKWPDSSEADHLQPPSAAVFVLAEMLCVSKRFHADMAVLFAALEDAEYAGASMKVIEDTPAMTWSPPPLTLWFFVFFGGGGHVCTATTIDLSRSN